MTTQNHTIGTTWTETVMDGDDFLLSLPSASRFDVDVATTDTVVAPTVGRGHVIAADLRKSITRALLGPGYVWTKAPKQYTATLSTWSSDLAAILALEGLVGYWPTDPAYLYSDDAGTTLATVGGSVAYRANLISGGPAAVQSTPANQPVLHKYSLSDFYWLETDDGSSTLTATTGDLGASCTVAYADANGAVFTEGVTISSTYSTTPAVGYNSDFMIFNRALTAAEKTLITRHLTRDRDFVQRELLAISGLTGYWKNDPQYLFEDSAGTTPASTSGTGPIGRWNPVGYVEVLGPTLTANALDLSKWAAYGSNTVELDSDAIKITYVGGTNSSNGGYAYITRSTDSPSGIMPSLLTVGKTYRFYADCKVNAGSSVIVECAQTTSSYSQPVTSTDFITVAFDFVCSITTGVVRFGLSMGSGEIIWIKNIRVTEVISTLGAYQSTTANKPILRKTPTTGVYWADSNTPTSALNVALGDLGSACTVARASAEGVTFTEGVTISSTYNIAPAFAFNSDVAIFNRALTATEKALITRYMARAVPMLGSNLVTNGTFDTDTTGWSTGSNTILSAIGGVLRVENNGSTTRYASQPTAITGKTYLFCASSRGDGSTGRGRIQLSVVALSVTSADYANTWRTLSMVGVAPGTALYLYNYSTTATGSYSEFDDVSCKEIL